MGLPRSSNGTLSRVPPVLELIGIQKRFGSVQALGGADFTLHPGEIHALLGENGAGKSTLMHVAYGMVRSDAGEVRVNGVVRKIGSPRQAREGGIGMVHQHFTSVPALTVAENVALTAGWAVGPHQLRDRVRVLSERLGLPLDPDQRAGRLAVALKQRLEIVKALAGEPRILLLDEPTSLLAPGETEELLRVIRAFTSSGGSAVLITHKLDEILRAANRVTVLRQGAVTYTGTMPGQTVESLTSAMIGPGSDRSSGFGALEAGAPPAAKRELIRLHALEVSRESGYGIALRHAALVVVSGEIVGIAAVEGNGQRELLRAVAGRIVPLRGRLEVAQPIGFIPEDRTSEGLIPELDLTQNMTLGLGRDAPWIRSGRIHWSEARARTAALLLDFSITASGPRAKAGSLSGGNQQKLVVARELARNPAVIVAENPTRGLDVVAGAAIHARLRSAAASGAAVLFHSTDLDEVLALAGRVLVVARGVISEAPPQASRATIGAMMLGGDG
jgi:general nucleoside transport system ATP-binding protein